jgi:hypothetical protein
VVFEYCGAAALLPARGRNLFYADLRALAAAGAIASGSQHSTKSAISHRIARSLSVSTPSS